MASLYGSITVLAALFQLTIHLNSCLAARTNLRKEANTQFIKTSCSGTVYPDLCITTLSSYASEIQASPKLLASTALSVTLNSTRSASKTMIKRSKSQGMKPREAEALSDCMEELRDSVYELQRSVGEMDQPGGKNFGLQMNDIETWVSAALTDEHTCMDGFSGKAMNGNVKTSVRSQIVKVAHMTSNALALVNSYAAAIQNP
ncbi:21 kDa protein-like [Herrania umbratica]|uniref:21 kDa protein-like n=1 Tax=Herrania umbratica TaxID=108875 RepID=A0A6J1AQH2_9ROSI|nr:21 kDa protein-like [Herrania umbratica]